MHLLSARATSSDNLHLRMTAQPRGHRCGLAIWQEIRDAVLLQVDNDGAVGPPLAPRPLVDADYPGHGRRGRRTVADDPLQGIGADGDGQSLSQTRPGFSA